MTSLRDEKPFLFLNVLTMAAQKFPGLQGTLEKEVRDVLGAKVISEGEQSLDLLQGMLVYLAWYAL